MTKMIAEIELAKVKQVYVGKNGRCCCGCAGTHTYAEDAQEDADAARIVKNVVRKLNKAIALQTDSSVARRLEDLGSCITLESEGGSTVSIVYFD